MLQNLHFLFLTVSHSDEPTDNGTSVETKSLMSGIDQVTSTMDCQKTVLADFCGTSSVIVRGKNYLKKPKSGLLTKFNLGLRRIFSSKL